MPSRRQSAWNAFERLAVGHRDVLRAARVLEPRVLGPDAGIVEAGRDRVRLLDLAVGVLHEIGSIAVQHARRARGERRRVLAGLQAVAARLDADQLHFRVRDVRVEDAHRVGAAAHAGEDRVRLPSRDGGHLHEALLADHRVEVAHHHGIGMRAGDGADDVERVLHVRHPVAHRLVQRVLERARAAVHRHHGRAQQLHAVHVLRLALDVLAAHVHHAFHAVARRDGRGGHAVLARAGLGDHARLAHAPRHHRLAHGVVHLVRARVVEVLALEVDLRAAQLLRQAPRVVDGAGTPDEVLEVVRQLLLELRVLAARAVGQRQLVERRAQGLGDEHAAVGAEVARRIRQRIVLPVRWVALHLHVARSE